MCGFVGFLDGDSSEDQVAVEAVLQRIAEAIIYPLPNINLWFRLAVVM